MLPRRNHFLQAICRGAVLGGFVPSAQIIKDPAMLYIAIGILGATVMPHNTLISTRP
jgi:manganese transport protein